MSRSILVVAGEVSGDMHAARLIRRLRERMDGGDGDLRVWGIGGDGMAAAGVELRYHVRDMAVLGLSEVLRRYFWFRRVFRDMVRRMEADRPDAVLLVDYPGFNLRFAAEAKRRGIKVLYYISPQVWAWKASRIPKMARLIDRLFVILPFEVEVFAGQGLRVDFVGHPLVEETAAALAAPARELAWGGGGGPRLALLPGSRRQEIDRILPALVETAERLRGRLGCRPLIAAASEEAVPTLRALAGDIPVVAGATREVLRQAEFGLVASGTATLEAALMECPHIVVYRTAPLTWCVGKRVVKLPHIGLVNIVAGEELSREFLQQEAAPAAMAEHVAGILGDPARLAGQVQALRRVRDRLGDEAAVDLAEAVLEELQSPPEERIPSA